MSGYNFTDRVQQILQMARDEAARLGHDYVAPEHILLGLVREGEGVAAAVLTNLNVDLEAIELVIDNRVAKGKGGRAPGPDFPYTGSARRVLELAMTEARELDHSYFGSEHLLLGLLREPKGIAADVLKELGVTLDQARAETLRLLGAEMPAGPPEPGRRPEILARMRSLVHELLAAPAPDASRLAVIATELGTLLDELAEMR
jgi:ATP-dependent Clp protease ATP-binding subunit ClpC